MHSPFEDTRFGPQYPSARVLSLSLNLYEKYCREWCPFILSPLHVNGFLCHGLEGYHNRHRLESHINTEITERFVDLCCERE